MRLRASNANAPFRYDNELTGKLIGIRLKQPAQRLNFDKGAFVLKAHQNHTMMRMLFSIDFFAEVLVVGDQNTILSIGFENNRFVIGAFCFIIYRKYIMPCVAKPFRDSRSCAFINEESHQTVSAMSGINDDDSSDFPANR